MIVRSSFLIQKSFDPIPHSWFFPDLALANNHEPPSQLPKLASDFRVSLFIFREFWFPKFALVCAAADTGGNRAGARSTHVQRLPFFGGEKQDQDYPASRAHEGGSGNPYREPNDERSSPASCQCCGCGTYARFVPHRSMDHSVSSSVLLSLAQLFLFRCFMRIGIKS